MKLVREPLVHFLLLGAALFAVFGLVGDSDETEIDKIVVSSGQIAQLSETFTRTWQRPPTAEELDGLIENHIREEVYYREAVAMGLDRDDTIIRRRMRQKLEFLTDDIAAAANPSEDDLRTYFADNLEVFRPSPRISFDQVLFNLDVRGEAGWEDARALINRLNETTDKVDPETLGDGLTLPAVFEDTTLERIGHQFGAAFAEGLAEAPIGSWSGPVQSGFGLHVVRLRERDEEANPEFESVRDVVEREWRAARREKAAEAFFEGLRKRYNIIIEADDGAVDEASRTADSRP